MRLLEREHALETLSTGAQRAVDGHGCVLVVAGEAGVGKTVLLRTFGEQVRGPAQLLWGLCDSLSTPRPLGPLRDVADELDLVSSPDLRRLQLAPLTRSAVADLLRGHELDPADVRRRTAGNPFFVSQILAQPDSPLPEPGSSGDLPISARPAPQIAAPVT